MREGDLPGGLHPVWHPFTQLRGFSPLGEVVGAHGPWLQLADGREVIDGISSWWVNLHGHAHPRVTAAIARQAATFDQVILADFTHGPAAELSRRLPAVLPTGLTRIFFSDDGSTAVEVALKMAWQHQRERAADRHRIVAFEGAYHGDTLGAMSVGDRDAFTLRFHDLLAPVDFLPWGDGAAFARWMADWGREVVAVIIEPMVQCAAGMRICAPSFLAEVERHTHAAGALLIADEVAVGFGRTGRMWGGDHADLRPDLVALSKGLTGGALPMGVTACSEEIYASFFGPDKRSAFLHGHSYTGNPIACAAALASLEVLQEERTVERLAGMSEVYAANAEALRALPGVSGVRWLGSILAFDLGQGGYHDPVGRVVQQRALARGLYVRPLGSVVYLMPPAALSLADLQRAVDVLIEVVRDLRA